MAEVQTLSPRDDGAEASHQAGETAVCLFAFASSADALGPLPDAMFEQRLLLHRVNSVGALVGVVPIAEYVGADSERRLSDVAWLAPRVRRHGELVEWAAQRSSVFPAPFATLYSSLDSLTAFMRAHEAAIVAFLAAVADKDEWELRAAAHFDEPDALDRLACDARPEWRKLSKGARYMRLCRDKSALIDFGRAQAAALMGEFVAELGPLTSDARQLGLARAADAGGPEPVARYALLIRRTSIASVRERIREMAETAESRAVAITLSGPWPPFSFRPDLR
ncbi:MAG: GvpL/GvpF family gas vesicle protein [Roseiarcus sp.]